MKIEKSIFRRASSRVYVPSTKVKGVIESILNLLNKLTIHFTIIIVNVLQEDDICRSIKDMKSNRADSHDPLK